MTVVLEISILSDISLSVIHLSLSRSCSICLMFLQSPPPLVDLHEAHVDALSPEAKLFSPFLYCGIRRRSLTIHAVQTLFGSSKPLFIEEFYYIAILNFRHCSISVQHALLARVPAPYWSTYRPETDKLSSPKIAIYIAHTFFHLAWLLYVRSETFGPYYIPESISYTGW
jgi:hypothetical protein